MPLPDHLRPALAQSLQRLRHATAARDQRAAATLCEQALHGPLAPRSLLEGAAEPDRAPLRDWVEAWDDVLQRWWLADDGPPEPWRRFLLPHRDRFTWPLLQMNAWWLRSAGSARVLEAETPALSAADLAGADLRDQALRLGRFCATADGGVPFDYEAVAAALKPELRPFLVTWFLTVYLMSPLSNTEARVADHRLAAMASFATFHAAHRVTPPANPLLGSAGFRVTNICEAPRAFLAALSGGVLGPALEPLRRRGSKKRRGGGAGGVGVALSCWREQHAVQRCIDPLLGRLRERGVRAYYLDGDAEAAHLRLPAAWLAEPVTMTALGPIRSARDVAAAARRIEADDLDLLLYPEVGLTTASRWLATQRLARVQAAAYGHPVTTGSAAIDCFLGGAEVEPDDAAERYGERLFLLPGLGVASTPPPPPSRPLAPLPDRVLLANLSTYDKLTEPLLRAWSRLMADAPPEAHLQLLPGIPPQRAVEASETLGAYFPRGNAALAIQIPRQECVDLLHQADIYLDSWPFGGYNTLVEALAAGCPVVTLEGASAPGRFGAALLRRLELPTWLIARDEAEYVEAARRLLTDGALRASIRARLPRERVLAALCHDDLAAALDEAVTRMRAC